MIDSPARAVANFLLWVSNFTDFPLWRARSLLWVLTRREVSARYAGSAAGVLWAYAQPLLTVAAYLLVFDGVFAMRVGAHGAQRAGVFLVAGALPWMAFGDALSRATSSLLEAGPLLQKNPLPPSLFPARAVLASVWVYAPLLLLLPLVYGPLQGVSRAWLALPLLLAAQVLLALLLGCALAVLAAAVRDTVHAVGFVLSIGVFLSPVLFPLALFPAGWRWLLFLNPMTPLVLGYQDALLQGAWPGGQTWGPWALWCLGAAALAALFWRRSREVLVDWL